MGNYRLCTCAYTRLPGNSIDGSLGSHTDMCRPCINGRPGKRRVKHTLDVSIPGQEIQESFADLWYGGFLGIAPAVEKHGFRIDGGCWVFWIQSPWGLSVLGCRCPMILQATQKTRKGLGLSAGVGGVLAVVCCFEVSGFYSLFFVFSCAGCVPSAVCTGTDQFGFFLWGLCTSFYSLYERHPRPECLERSVPLQDIVSRLPSFRRLHPSPARL